MCPVRFKSVLALCLVEWQYIQRLRGLMQAEKPIEVIGLFLLNVFSLLLPWLFLPCKSWVKGFYQSPYHTHLQVYLNCSNVTFLFLFVLFCLFFSLFCATLSQEKKNPHVLQYMKNLQASINVLIVPNSESNWYPWKIFRISFLNLFTKTFFFSSI